MRNHLIDRPAGSKRTIWRLILGIWLMVMSAGTARAQVTASISGRVLDASGAAIPGAAVTATNVETGATRTVETDAGGSYRLLSLAVGAYEIRAGKPGFQVAV